MGEPGEARRGSLRRQASRYMNELRADERDELRHRGRRDGPLWMLTHLFPSAVQAEDAGGAGADERVASVGGLSASELAGRLLWKKKVLPADEWWARFGQVMLALAEFRAHDEVLESERGEQLQTALEAVARWVQRVGEEDADRLYLFFSDRGAYPHVDTLLERLPAVSGLVESLFVSVGLDQEDAAAFEADGGPPARLPVCRATARLCAALALDDAIGPAGRARAGLALSRMDADTLRPYERQLQAMADGSHERAAGEPLPARVKWACTKALLRLWQADNAVAARVAERDESDRSMVARAAAEGNERLVRLLLDCGGRADDRDAEGRTPLVLAARAGHAEAARALLEGGADHAAEDRAGLTALQYAAGNGDRATVAVLAAAGADLERVDVYRRTPLLAAAHDGNTDAVEALVEGGCSRTARDKDGRDALMLAAGFGGGSTVNELVRLGFDLTASDDDRRSALSLAAEHGRVDAARTILTVLQRGVAEGRRWVGFSINDAALNGMTPLMYAAAGGHRFVVRLLLEAGADPTVLDRPVAGRDALKYAVQGGHTDTARELREAGRRLESWETSEERAADKHYEDALKEARAAAASSADLAEQYRPSYDAVAEQFDFASLLRHAWA